MPNWGKSKIRRQLILELFNQRLSLTEICEKLNITFRSLTRDLRIMNIDYEKSRTKKNGLYFSDTERQCSKCLIIKSKNNFFKDNHSPSGFRSDCDTCNTQKSIEYIQNHPEERQSYRRDYHIKNKEKLKKYKQDNKDKINKQKKSRYTNNPDFRQKTIESAKIYRRNPENKEKIRATARRSIKKYRENNPSHKIMSTLRRRLIFVLHGQRKVNNTMNLLGCTREFFIDYIKSKWQKKMNWRNFGLWKLNGPRKWVLDHIIPCESFNFKNPEDQKKCFHYTNLQPLWGDQNLAKGDKSPEEWAAIQHLYP